jgi:four helix bundle protein
VPGTHANRPRRDRHELCQKSCVGVRDFRDLVAWQLSYALHREIMALTANKPVARDFAFCDQIKRASASAPSNIAEGFARFRPGDFIRYLEFAAGSLQETQNHLIDGRDRGYVADPLYSRLYNLSCAALRATTNLLLSLRRHR